MNISKKIDMYELLKSNLKSKFNLLPVAFSDDFHYFHFDLFSNENDIHFEKDIKRAAEIFHIYYDSISTNYIISTNISYKDIDNELLTSLDSMGHCKRDFETVKDLLIHTSEKAYTKYFDIRNDLMFFDMTETLLSKFTLIKENKQNVYALINSHEHYTAYPIIKNSAIETKLFNWHYYFRPKDEFLSMTGDFVFYSGEDSTVTYDISLVQETSSFIQEFSSILEKEKQENELKHLFAKESNKLTLLIMYLTHLTREDGIFQTLRVNNTVPPDMDFYSVLLDYFQNDYEAINRLAHERLALFENKGIMQVDLNHPLVDISPYEETESVNFGEIVDSATIILTQKVIRIDFSLPTKREKLFLVTKTNEEGFSFSGNPIRIELFQQ